ncbi:DinB family protein [Mycolicibacterium moriokaense]|nr:DinB family protein [Mycolicibacterium moriokaense]
MDLPPLASEDHRCSACAIAYPDVSIADAVERIAALRCEVAASVAGVSDATLRRRPEPRVWSAIEYLCHIRDVYMAYTIRLHRTRTEDRPALEPMLSDLRARRFRYNDHQPAPVLDELGMAAAGFCDEIARFDTSGWQRTASRLPGEHRTALWLVRQAMHEGVHHLGDIRTVIARVG